MNIKDANIEDYEVSENNLFDDLLVRQNQLIQELYAADKVDGLPDGTHKPQLIRDSLRRSLEEAYEANLCLKNKPWKNTEVLTDEEHFKEEMADAIHFYLEAIIFFPWYEEVPIPELIENIEEGDIHSSDTQREIKDTILTFTEDCIDVIKNNDEYSLKHGLFSLFRICKMAGMDAQEIHDTYIKKWKVNLWRIKTNY